MHLPESNFDHTGSHEIPVPPQGLTDAERTQLVRHLVEMIERGTIYPKGFDFATLACEDPCPYYLPGHRTHRIQARQAWTSPQDYRDAVVCAVEDQHLLLRRLDDGRLVRLWHHRPLGDEVACGDPVSLHEGMHLLAVGRRRICVLVEHTTRP